MRKLMWFAVGFSASCAAGAYLLFGNWLLLLGAFCAIPFGMLFFIHSLTARKVQCVLLGMLIGVIWYWGFQQLYLQPVQQMDGQIQYLEIEVSDYSRSTEYGIAVEGKTELAGKTYAVQFYLNGQYSPKPGDWVKGGFRLRYTGGGSEKPTYHLGKGIFLLCYPKGTQELVQLEKIPAKHTAILLRHKILTLTDALFPEDTRGFAKALLLGDTDGLSYKDSWNLRTAGVYHVVAVSGMHVSILFALIFLLCGKRKVLTALIGIPALLLFAAVAGFSPSVVRACIMQSLMILAMLVNKEYDPPTALAAAVLVLLGANPLGITSVSLQLSVGCMIGIFLFSAGIYNYLLPAAQREAAKRRSLKDKLTRWVVGSLSVTLGAMSLTTPLCAMYFGNVSLAGIATNLLVLWLISLVFYGVIAACVFGALWPSLGIGIGWAVSWPIRMIMGVVNMVSKVPVAAVYTSSIYIVAWLIFCYVLFVVFKKHKKKHPVVLTCCLLVGLAGALICSWLEPRLDDYRITAVDVGQGQCIVLQTDGKYYVVDCGGDDDDQAANRAAQLLLSQGVFRLDGLILTHYDADHAGGVQQLLSVIPADALYLPVQEEHKVQEELAQKFAEIVQWVTEPVNLEDADITILPSSNTEETNDGSLCILFQPENCDILITGDRSTEGEAELLASTQLPDLEILIAGHHGSRTSTSWELLNATKPEIVIISVGEDNSYGHPSWETLERLQLFGCQVYRTDLEGTIIFRG